MRKKTLILLFSLLAFSAGIFAQNIDVAARNVRWKEFSKNNLKLSIHAHENNMHIPK